MEKVYTLKENEAYEIGIFLAGLLYELELNPSMTPDLNKGLLKHYIKFLRDGVKE